MQTKTSARSLEAWLAELGSRATVALAEENGFIHKPANAECIRRRAREAIARRARKERR